MILTSNRQVQPSRGVQVVIANHPDGLRLRHETRCGALVAAVHHPQGGDEQHADVERTGSGQVGLHGSLGPFRE